MKRLLFSLLVVMVSLNLAAQQPDPAFTSQRLLDRLDQMPGEPQNIYVFLSDKVDVEGMLNTYQQQRTPIDQRAREVIDALRQKAAATQGPLIDLIGNSTGLVPGTLEAYWITNAIGATADVSLIAELSRHPAVSFIDWAAPAEPTEYLNEGPAPLFSPDGTEPGLDAINVAPLWQMGYSGYGTISFIMDTGVEFMHPAIVARFRGLYTDDQGDVYLNGTNEYPFDCDGHGTHVTGTVLGLDRHMNDTIGVAINSLWIAADNIGCGDGPGTMAAFQWALNPDGNFTTTDDIPHVINNSWYTGAGADCNGDFASIFTALEAAGVAVVFANGNFGPGDGTVTAPAYINTGLVNTFGVGNLNANNASLPINNGSSRGPSPCFSTDSSLQIKPEVSAPGTQVRSCVPGGYSNFTGTSMASPHVAGAVSILKEAFPAASGTDIKLALYFTATDLGQPGEDNTYGMGIINVEAAYYYLIDEGFQPAEPTTENDLLVYRMNADAIFCNGSPLTPTVFLENGGTNSISSFTIAYWIDGGSVFEYDWTGDLPSGDRLELTLPAEEADGSGDWIWVEITSVNGVADARPFNNRLRLPVTVIDKDALAPFAITTETGSFCEGQPTFLRAEADGPGSPVFTWYDVPEGGSPVATGDVFETPALSQPATYYVDAIYLAHTGMPSPTLGDQDVIEITDGQGLIFDAYQPFDLLSVWVDAPQTGPRIIELRDSDGGLVATRFVQVTETGPQRLDLNISIPVGDNHRLIVGGGLGFVYNISGHEFPYEVADYLSVERSLTPFGSTSQIYYFFYDWEVSIEEPCGRTAYEVVPSGTGSAPDAQFSLINTTMTIGETLQLTNETSNGEEWLWLFGNGDSSTDFEPAYSFDTPGFYTVSLSASSSDGCTDVYSQLVEVTPPLVSTNEAILNESSFDLYPNPADSEIWLQLLHPATGPIPYRIYNISGQEVSAGQVYGSSALIGLDGLPGGLYILQLQLEGRWIGEKFVIR